MTANGVTIGSVASSARVSFVLLRMDGCDRPGQAGIGATTQLYAEAGTKRAKPDVD